MVIDVEGLIEKRSLSLKSIKSHKEDKLAWNMLDNVVDKTVDILMEVNRVGVLYDVDVDGLVAGKIIEETISKKGLMVFSTMNKRKKHGITEDTIEWVKEKRIELLYVVDAGSNDIEMHQLLSDMGVIVIVLDHHPIWYRKSIKNVYIVNCFDGEHLPDLSGAGVCFRYVELLNKVISSGSDVTHYEPWVGLTVLSDHCSMLDPENRYYVDKLYDNYDTIDLFKAFSFWGSKRNLFLFSVIPFLNACVRLNEIDIAIEAIKLRDELKAKKFIEKYRQEMLDRQKELVKEMKEKCKIINGEDIFLVRLDDEHLEYSGLSGLLGNNIMNDVKKSVIVIYREDGQFKGSFRGRGSVNKEVLEKLGWTVKGHDQAAGVELDEKIANEVVNKTKTYVADGVVSDFDFEISDTDVFRNMNKLEELARFNENTGGDLPTLKFRLKVRRNPDKRLRGKRVTYDFGSFQIRDFNLNRRTDEDWIIEPLLDKKGIVLLRQ